MLEAIRLFRVGRIDLSYYSDTVTCFELNIYITARELAY
jgi:hypothetical protein